MSYISVWVCQVIAMVVWQYIGQGLSFLEWTAGTFFSATALFTHWACHRSRNA